MSCQASMWKTFICPKAKSTRPWRMQRYPLKSRNHWQRNFQILTQGKSKGINWFPKANLWPLADSIGEINSHSRKCKRGLVQQRKHQNPSHFPTRQIPLSNRIANGILHKTSGTFPLPSFYSTFCWGIEREGPSDKEVINEKLQVCSFSTWNEIPAYMR